MLLAYKYDPVERKQLSSVCLGSEAADVAIVGGSIVDVAVGEVRRADVAIKGNRIAYVGEIGNVKTADSTTTIDASGKFIVPGFLDPHTHVESTMLTPSAYASLVTPSGTTGAVVDPHEVANVSGIEGLRAFLEDAKQTPFKFYVQAPSCVPSAPGLETSGQILDTAAIQKLLSLEGVWGLAEVMSYNEVIEGNPEVLEKIKLAYQKGAIVDGHSPIIRDARFQAYMATGGIATDHTARTAEEVTERLRSGMHVLIQNRPGESSFDAIVNDLKTMGTRRAMFCTDDIEPDEVVERGHLISIVRTAIEFGLDPIKAIQMVTLNVSEAYRIDSEVGIVAPGRFADLIILADLQQLAVHKVLQNGRIAASEGKSLIPLPKPNLHAFRATVKIRKILSPEDLVTRMNQQTGKAKVRVVRVDGELEEKELDVSNYEIQPEVVDDIVRMVVLERHGINGNIGRGFIRGTGLKSGAIATSISHDAHNLCSIGVSKEDLYQSVREVEKMGGGLVAVRDGKILERVELPYFGLLSADLNTAAKVKNLRIAAQNLGLKIPLRRLMFLSLPVGRGNYKITDIGLVSYTERKVLPVVPLSA